MAQALALKVYKKYSPWFDLWPSVGVDKAAENIYSQKQKMDCSRTVRHLNFKAPQITMVNLSGVHSSLQFDAKLRLNEHKNKQQRWNHLKHGI